MYKLDAGEFLKFNPDAKVVVAFNREYGIFIAEITGVRDERLAPPNAIGTGKSIYAAIKDLFTEHNYAVANLS